MWLSWWIITWPWPEVAVHECIVKGSEWHSGAEWCWVVLLDVLISLCTFTRVSAISAGCSLISQSRRVKRTIRRKIYIFKSIKFEWFTSSEEWKCQQSFEMSSLSCDWWVISWFVINWPIERQQDDHILHWRCGECKFLWVL